jgi:hypothetical protein
MKLGEARSNAEVESLCYKPESPGLETDEVNDFLFDLRNHSNRIRPCGSLSL